MSEVAANIQVSNPSVEAIQFPDISPIIFKAGFFELRWYSLAYLIGIIGGWLYIMYVNRKHGDNKLTQQMIDALPMWMVLGIVLGGRIGYVLFYNLGYYLQNPSEIIALWKGGMSFHGGLIGTILSAYLFCRTYKLKFLTLTDFLAVAAPLGLFLGRIANFINGELYGRVTDWKYGVIFPGQYYPRHASQLYEGFLEGFILFFILMLAVFKFNALKRTGTASAIFLMWYAACRFVIEFFREPDVQMGYFAEYFTMGQILCIPMLLIGAWIFIKGGNRNAA